MFYVGQKVVCVDAKPRNYGTCSLVEGAVYTVRRVDPKYGVFLNEVRALFEHEGSGFFEDRFRPAVERKPDISIFTAMLNTAKTPERV